jgi:predicted permease
MMRRPRWWSRAAHERQRAEEMRAHLDLYVDELVARGRTREQAEREARLAFGNPRVKLEEIHQMTRLPILDSLGRDLRYAVRVLRRTPAFTSTAIVTLALVIGACTAVFTLADAILLRPLPYPDPSRLAFVERTSAGPRGVFSATYQDGAIWEAVRDRAPAIDPAVFALGGGGANLVVGESAAYVRQHRVSAGYFRVLGIAPVHGRAFTDDEDRSGGPAVTVLSHETWRRYFNGDPGIVGRPILLKGEPCTVVGVMPQSFAGVQVADLWTPLRATSTGEGGGTNFQIIARLRPEAKWEQANAQLAAVGSEAFRLFKPGPDVTRTLGVKPMQVEIVADTRSPIVILSWAVGCVLLIACVNLAALLLARGGGRTKEIATRMALGSGRSGVIRQLMVEAIVLAVVGGGLGVLVGYLGLEGLKSLGSEMYDEWDRVTLDGRVLVLTFGLSLVTSLLFGLIPAVQASRLDVNAALTESGSRGVAGGSRHWPRRLLVVTEVALGVALLVTTGLLIRTFVNLRSLTPGFDSSGLVTASVSLQDARYTTAAQINQLFDESLRRLRATPGVETATVSLKLPYERLLNKGFKFVDESEAPVTNVTYVSPGFFETLRIPVRRGRGVLETDTATAPPIVVVNESFVRIYSKDREILGRRLRLGNVEREVVGVVGNVQQRPSFLVPELGQGPLVPMPIIFEPAAQTNDAEYRTSHIWFSPVWTVRSRSTADASLALRRAISGADPMLPVSSVQSMKEVMATSTSIWRLMMTLVGVLAAAAVLLAAIGIHGLIAHSVVERRREFGIRMALGASAGQAVRRVALGGIVLSFTGAVIGGLLSVLSVGLVQSFLVGVQPHDPMTYAGVALFLLIVATVASVLPALRILRLDPAETLRN